MNFPKKKNQATSRGRRCCWRLLGLADRLEIARMDRFLWLLFSTVVIGCLPSSFVLLPLVRGLLLEQRPAMGLVLFAYGFGAVLRVVEDGFVLAVLSFCALRIPIPPLLQPLLPLPLTPSSRHWTSVLRSLISSDVGITTFLVFFTLVTMSPFASRARSKPSPSLL